MYLQFPRFICKNCIVLQQNSSQPLSTCICTYHKLFIWICNFQYRSCSEFQLQFFKTVLALFSPLKVDTLPLQGSYGICYGRKSLHKSLIIGYNSHEWSYCWNINWYRPLFNSFYLVRINIQPLFWNNLPQVLNPWLIKLKIAEFCMQLVFS